MTLNGKLTFPPFPPGVRYSVDEFIQWLSENSQIPLEGQGFLGQIDGALPTEDVGIIFLADGIYKYDSDRGLYRTITDVPVGGVTLYAAGPAIPDTSAEAPDNFLYCFGQEVNKESYALLYEEIGDRWGTAESSDNFVLPSQNGRYLKFAGAADYGLGFAGQQNIEGKVGPEIELGYNGYRGTHSIRRGLKGAGQPANGLFNLEFKINGQLILIPADSRYVSCEPQAVSFNAIIRYQ